MHLSLWNLKRGIILFMKSKSYSHEDTESIFTKKE